MSGEGDEYTDDDINDFYDAISDAWEESEEESGGGAGSGFTATAQVEWAGEIANNGRGGVRAVSLTGIDTTAVAAAIKEARKAEERAARGPLRSYSAKGPNARFSQLEKTAAGRAALEAAGLSATTRTQLAWITGETTPSKANRAKIDEAYGNVQNPGRSVMGARRNVVDKLTDAIRDRYGSTVRFRDVESFEFD